MILKMKKLQAYLVLLILLITTPSFCQVVLPKIISDGMVLQRNEDINIWGWSAPNEAIKINFKNKTYKTKANETGKWFVTLKKMKAGGPYNMEIAGEKNTIAIKDILVGDVWLCSGQSNMVHQLDIHDVTYADVIEHANTPDIRHFKIPTTTSLTGSKNDLEGGSWQKAIPSEIRSFSAVAYFFAKKIHDKHHIPIGLINASVGGTPIEAWTPESGFKQFPDILKIITENKDSTFVEEQMAFFKSKKQPIDLSVDKGLTASKPWYATDFNSKNWRNINIPGYWEDQGIRDLNGIVWYRKTITVPKTMTGIPSKIFLGRIVDADELYINGEKVANTTYQYPQRRYHLAETVLKPGKNTIAIRVINYSGKGGFVPDKPYYLTTKQDTLDLKGYWNYKVGAVFENDKATNISEKEAATYRNINPQNEPTSLYNAMVAPITNYNIKGALWYQGESNSWQPEHYKDYLVNLITNWRAVFNKPKLPFIYAQLPNFMEVNYSPSESSWAILRNKQLQALETPNTAMTVNIDLGEWNDIHPDNKKDVGERMALAGLALAYHENMVYSGPIYKNHTIEGNKVNIFFTHLGSGLKIKQGDALQEFAIAGADKKYVWAHAKIVDNHIVVWSDKIENPKYIKYAWADNPNNPNLYNKEDLPASPFKIEL